MSEFEDYIKARYPVDYDSLKEKYPNVHVCEFYGDEQDLWDLKQAEIDDSENTRAVLYRENMDLREKNIELQLRVDQLNQWNNNQYQLIKCEESDAQSLKRLLQKIIDDDYTTMRPSMVYEIQQALRGEHE